ncbi:MAG: hypothetical protein KAY06_11545, partial [Aeromonadaceae bacterium]|nr:hypothetical protein [Aeromonadaceae bacterium]
IGGIRQDLDPGLGVRHHAQPQQQATPDAHKPAPPEKACIKHSNPLRLPLLPRHISCHLFIG